VLRRGWYIDPLYARIVETPGRALAAFSAFVVDSKLIDGVVNGLGAVVRFGGSRLRTVQTGYVRNYALVIAAGAVLVLGYVVAKIGI
jgi:NADH-quinone oxidoreductase subunit L